MATYSEQEASEVFRGLREAGYEPAGYIGRGMRVWCISVTISRVEGLYSLGSHVGHLTSCEPTTDSMGLEVIAYWPRLVWTQAMMEEAREYSEPDDDLDPALGADEASR